jgi:uncharacterized repeat protein (TIGR01451 family)
MNAKFSRFVVAAAIAALVVLAGTATVLAQVPNFPSGFSSSQVCSSSSPATCPITVNGSIFASDGTFFPYVPSETSVLRLTDDTSDLRGSAWFSTAQPVTHGFTTTFKFQLSSADSRGDGFAFVVQRQSEGSLFAIGGFGGGEGYATRCSTASESTNHCVADGSDAGIPNSLAIEFDTFANGYDPTGGTDSNHIGIQSCPNALPNSPNHHECTFGTVSLPQGPEVATDLGHGQHTVRIDYTPFVSCGDDICPANLFVYLDGGTTPVLSATVDLGGQLGLGDGTSAYVGFTAATKGSHEAHDILSWTFSSGQTKQVTTGGTTVFNFGGYDYTVKLNTGDPVNVTVAPVLKTQAECSALVLPTFPGAQCFVYNNSDGMGGKSAVMFEVTCPDSSNNECGQDVTFDAELGSDYSFDKATNPDYRGTSGTGNPLPGWLKGQPADHIHPCNPNSGNSPALFQSNQIESFVVVGDPTATTKGKSGGTGSCWVATYNTPNELPSVTGTIPANGANYPQGSTLTSNLACKAVNMPTNDPKIGPYLTVPATVQVQDPPIPPVLGCSLRVDGGTPIDLTTTPNPQLPTTGTSHTVVVTVTDSATDTTTSTPITYNVVGPTDVAILKVGPLLAPIKSKVTYVIGVGDIGSQPAVDVNVSDILPANTTLVAGSVSASKVSCSIVNRRLVCTTTPVSCASTATSVSCSVGSLQPLSLSSLNGATIKLSVQLGTALTAGKVVKNTATVSSTNTDTHTSNNSSTASTLLTAH